MKRIKQTIGFSALILAWLAFAPAMAVERGKLPMATDLAKVAKEAEAKQIPVLILFSSAGCSYCNRVREEILIPTTLNADYDNKVIMLEIETGSYTKIIDFDGKRISQAAFAAKHKAGFTPTVKFFDHRGREVAEPIVGLVTVDYYGGFLDQGIDSSIMKIRGASRVTGTSTELLDAVNR